MFVREGGLVLCACEHPLAYHAPRYAWYFHEGSSEATKTAPLVSRCAFCDCTDPHKGDFQGIYLRQSDHPKGE